jgi:hypothetical protein
MIPTRRLLFFALSIGLSVSGLLWVQSPSVRASAPAATSTTVAIIGVIDLPGSGFVENPYVSADDTVYVPTSGANYVAVLAPGKTSGSLDDSIVATYPRAVVVSQDDTVFIAEYTQQRVAAFPSGAASAAYTISVPEYPLGLALSRDDTLAISQYFGPGGGDFSLVRRNAQTPTVTISAIAGAGNSPTQIATDSNGNFYVGSDASSVKVVPYNGVTVSSTLTGYIMAVQPGFTSDDTLLVLDRGTASLKIVPQGSVTPSASVSLGGTVVAMDVGPDNRAYVSDYGNSAVKRVDPVTQQAQTILTGMTSTHGVVVTSAGTIYVTTNGASKSVVAAQEVSAAVTPASGSAGDPVAVALSGMPSGILMDDSTITSVWWGDDTLPFVRNAGTNAVSVIPPPGSGSVPIVVEVNGGSPLAAGSFTYSTAPPPAPAYPPSAPQAVAVLAGDATATVSWEAPESSGSYPISHYQVRAVSGFGSCLSTALSCEISGLTNGTEYSFEVRALNGAGWGSWSTATSPVTPRAVSVVISGTRESVRGRSGIVVTGVSTGLEAGAILRPWMRYPGQMTFTEGVSDILVSMSGEFSWQRRTAKRVTVYVQSPDGSVTSNRVTIQ